MNDLDNSKLVKLLKLKRQSLCGLLQNLVAFEQRYLVEVLVVGSVAQCQYWLDSDLDVFLPAGQDSDLHAAWFELSRTDSTFDMIIDPAIEYKRQILAEGRRPQVLLDLLNKFHDEAMLIAAFPNVRKAKILRTLDNSRFFIAELASIKSNTLSPVTLQWQFKVEQVAFRFVWVSVMILSRYDHLFHPIGAEIRHQVSASDWMDWVGELAQASQQRPAFEVKYAELIAHFYRNKTACDEFAVQDVDSWIDAFWAFDSYTRDWLAEHWLPQL